MVGKPLGRWKPTCLLLPQETESDAFCSSTLNDYSKREGEEFFEVDNTVEEESVTFICARVRLVWFLVVEGPSPFVDRISWNDSCDRP